MLMVASAACTGLKNSVSTIALRYWYHAISHEYRHAKAILCWCTEKKDRKIERNSSENKRLVPCTGLIHAIKEHLDLGECRADICLIFYLPYPNIENIF